MEITQECNINCKYCFYNDYGRSKKQLTLNKIKKLLVQIPTLKEFYLTGGDCLLSPEIEEITKFLSKKGKVTIFTNGIELKDTNKEKLESFFSNISKIIITVDSFREDYSLRNTIDIDFRELLKKILEINGIILEIKVCINTFNIDYFEEIVNELREIGIKNISINFIHNIKSSSIDFEISSNKKISKVFDSIEKNIDLFNIKNINDYKTFFFNKNGDLGKTCRAGKDTIFINCIGEIYNCPADLSLYDMKKEKNEEEKNCMNKECISLWEIYND